MSTPTQVFTKTRVLQNTSGRLLLQDSIFISIVTFHNSEYGYFLRSECEGNLTFATFKLNQADFFHEYIS